MTPFLPHTGLICLSRRGCWLGFCRSRVSNVNQSYCFSVHYVSAQEMSSKRGSRDFLWELTHVCNLEKESDINPCRMCLTHYQFITKWGRLFIHQPQWLLGSSVYKLLFILVAILFLEEPGWSPAQVPSYFIISFHLLILKYFPNEDRQLCHEWVYCTLLTFELGYFHICPDKMYLFFY